MQKIPTWEQVRSNLKKGPFFGHMVGLEVAISPPVPVVTSSGAGAGVLLLRTEPKQPGETHILKPQASLVLNLPGCEIARYENYLLLDPAPQVRPDETVGRFPHPQIANWNRDELKSRTEAYFNKFKVFFQVAATPGEAHTKEQARELAAMVALFSTLVNPGLRLYLLALGKDFRVLVEKVVASRGHGAAREAVGTKTRPENRSKSGNMLDAISRLTGPAREDK